MKADIHPKVHPVIFVDTSSGAEFITVSTLTSKETKKINGVDHYIIKVEISSASHPFYTGKRKLVDTAGRVEKFEARKRRAEELQKEKSGKEEESEDEPEEVEEESENKPEEVEGEPKESTEEEEEKEEPEEKK